MQPSSRTDFKTYCLRKLGAPVLEINLATEQCEDLIDDALQMFQERTYDGAADTHLKYEITQTDIDRGKGPGATDPVGIVTTNATSTVGIASTFAWKENSNFLQVLPEVIGVSKIFHIFGVLQNFLVMQ